MTTALPMLQADWPAPPGVHALTTRRHGAGISPAPFAQFNLGNRHAADGDTPANVEHNRQLLQQGLALPSAPHWLRQVHSSTVLRFGAPPVEGASEPVADAAVTSVPGVVLAILTADCLPVVFAAADGREVGAAHAGWRGLADGMLEADVEGDALVRTPADNQTVRNVFVIGPDKKLKLLLVYPMTTGRNFDEVLRVIDSLQLTAKHKVATPAQWQQGDDVIIAGSVDNEAAKQIWPDGWQEPKPYIRIVPQPS